MTNPLLKAAGIQPATRGFTAERDLLNAAWECVQELRRTSSISVRRRCCDATVFAPHTVYCPVAAFDKAAKFFQEDV
jgi:hypothetical protein